MPLLHCHIGLFDALVLVGKIIVWSIDGCTIKNIIQVLRWSAYGGEPCKDSKNLDISILGLDG
ncbi:unnamed protein product [Lupinus luteus]|uniref:Uncharacterized protein n=1 Tax=Lupinus luteus TaxID=3873 RepID=A0AAV1WKI3_LUPLU